MPPAIVPALSAFAALGAVLSAVDLRTRRLPDAILLPGGAVVVALLSVAAVLAGEPSRGTTIALGAGGAFLACLLIHVRRPAAFGGGDVKLAGLCGAVLGWDGPDAVASGICLGFVAGGVAAAGVALAGARRGSIAFGPFLLLGTWWRLFTGPG